MCHCNTCTGSWSGNWLNYVTTARIDALRKVLYGGRRYVDTATDTVLERSHIPQDAHSWGKQYFAAWPWMAMTSPNTRRCALPTGWPVAT